jgi:hypothetical protein
MQLEVLANQLDILERELHIAKAIFKQEHAYIDALISTNSAKIDSIHRQFYELKGLIKEAHIRQQQQDMVDTHISD